MPISSRGAYHYCNVPGCGKPIRSAWAKFCRRHGAIRRQHGHPLQERIKAAELDKYLPRVKRAMRFTNVEALTFVLEQQHRILLDWCEDASRNAVTKYVRKAGDELHRILSGIAPLRVAERFAGMCLLYKYEPERFEDVTAFRYQMYHALRRLVAASIDSYWNESSQRVVKRYRIMPQQGMTWACDCLFETYSKFAAKIITLDERLQSYHPKQGYRLTKAFGAHLFGAN
jgi:transcriptional regulator with GAF, ATPase, and Fis domain